MFQTAKSISKAEKTKNNAHVRRRTHRNEKLKEQCNQVGNPYIARRKSPLHPTETNYSEKKHKYADDFESCYPPADVLQVPELPPGLNQDLWELQFCRWWGWNWVRKKQEMVNRQRSPRNLKL